MDEQQQQLEGIGSFLDTTAGDQDLEFYLERFARHLPDCSTPADDPDECRYCRATSSSTSQLSQSSPDACSPTATRYLRRTYADVTRPSQTRYRRPTPGRQPTLRRSHTAILGSAQHGAPSPRVGNATTMSHPNNPRTYAQAVRTQIAQTAPCPPASARPANYQHSSSSNATQRWSARLIDPCRPSNPQSRSFNVFPNSFQRQANQTFGQPSLHPMTTQSFPQAQGTPMIYLNDQVPMHPFLSPDTRNIANIIEAVDQNRTHLPFNIPTTPQLNSSIHSGTPNPPSIITTSSRSSATTSTPRRTGKALLDPSLPHRCTRPKCGNPFDKSECGKTFDKPGGLRRHIQSVHTVERPHKCDSCNKTFLYPKDVRRHWRTKHLEQKEEFKCPECEKSYTRADLLRRHVTASHSVDSGYGGTMSRTVSERSEISM